MRKRLKYVMELIAFFTKNVAPFISEKDIDLLRQCRGMDGFKKRMIQVLPPLELKAMNMQEECSLRVIKHLILHDTEHIHFGGIRNLGLSKLFELLNDEYLGQESETNRFNLNVALIPLQELCPEEIEVEHFLQLKKHHNFDVFELNEMLAFVVSLAGREKDLPENKIHCAVFGCRRGYYKIVFERRSERYYLSLEESNNNIFFGDAEFLIAKIK
ncbi:hypothetical protein ACFL08_00925 [Patescibacteria group bacterium]